VRAITDETGAVVSRHDYLPFGEDTQPLTGDPMRFAGKELDPESALQNFEARYYRNTWGRFTQVDPVDGSLSDTQSWNRYAYARNNPLRFTDPSGLSYSGQVLLPDAAGPVFYGLSDEGFSAFVTRYILRLIGTSFDGLLYDWTGNRVGDYHYSSDGPGSEMPNPGPERPGPLPDPQGPGNGDGGGGGSSAPPAPPSPTCPSCGPTPPPPPPPPPGPGCDDCGPKNPPPAAPDEQKKDSKFQTFVSCAAEHYGVTELVTELVTRGVSFAGLIPVGKRVIKMPVLRGTSDFTNVFSIVGSFRFAVID
jgi:RHS repeat-associated protein